MGKKKNPPLSAQFEALTIKKQMKILAAKAASSKLYYREIIDEFEKTLLHAFLERHDHNVLQMSMQVKLHRNTIALKMKKHRIREKEKKARE